MAKKKIYKHHQRTTIAQALTDAQTRELVLGSDERQVAIPFSDGKQLVLNPNYDVSAFGAVGDGSTDDAAIILSVFNLIRTKGKGTIWFPPGKTFMVSYGFHVPPKCTIRLNGSTIKATTTFGQGTIPSGAFGSAMLAIGASVTSDAALSEDYTDVFIYGGGGTLDGNYLNQTGSPPGYDGIRLETNPSPIEDNFLRCKNYLIQDLTITTPRRYPLYLQGVENCVVRNVRCLYGGTNGCSVIGGKNILFDNVEASWTRVNDDTPTPIPEYGFGFWNEPNQTWETTENVKYVNCFASYNWQGGFLAWNPGQDCGADVKLINCKSYRNSWDASATPALYTGIPGDYRSSVDASGFQAAIQGSYVGNYCIEFEACTAIEEYQSGFKAKRSTGNQTNSLIRFNNCTAFHCVVDDADGYERGAFSVVGTSNPTAAARVEILNPTIIAPSGNTAGYLLAVLYTKDVIVKNPSYFGPATYNAVYGNLPTSRFQTGAAQYEVLDFGEDTKTGILGSAPMFLPPVRPAAFDQTGSPTHVHTNEIYFWEDDNDQNTLIWNRDDGTKRYCDFRVKRKIRGSAAYGGSTLAAGDIIGGNITVTGAALGDSVRFSYDQTLNTGGSGLELWAFVSAVNTVRWVIRNHASTSRDVPAGNVYVMVEDMSY